MDPRPETPLAAALGSAFPIAFDPKGRLVDPSLEAAVAPGGSLAAQLAAMIGYDPARQWGHLCSGGTVANLEALWVARHLHPGTVVVASETLSRRPPLAAAR